MMQTPTSANTQLPLLSDCDPRRCPLDAALRQYVTAQPFLRQRYVDTVVLSANDDASG